jgi:hypothetical protein
MEEIKAIKVWESVSGDLLGWYPVKRDESNTGSVSALPGRVSLGTLTKNQCYPTPEEAIKAYEKLTDKQNA